MAAQQGQRNNDIGYSVALVVVMVEEIGRIYVHNVSIGFVVGCIERGDRGRRVHVQHEHVDTHAQSLNQRAHLQEAGNTRNRGQHKLRTYMCISVCVRMCVMCVMCVCICV
jgi:hypothetical protein